NAKRCHLCSPLECGLWQFVRLAAQVGQHGVCGCFVIHAAHLLAVDVQNQEPAAVAFECVDAFVGERADAHDFTSRAASIASANSKDTAASMAGVIFFGAFSQLKISENGHSMAKLSRSSLTT